MNPERWKRVETLYHAAQARPAGERGAYLAGACGDDEELRRDVESLLNEPGSTDGFAAGPALPAAVQMVAGLIPASMTGRTLGGYHLQALLGAGGMGEVYKARDAKLGRDVAIKILPAVFTADSERLARFEREARVLASLNHPNICAIYGLEHVDGIRFLILELVDGQTLGDRLAQRSGPAAPGLSQPKPIATGPETGSRALPLAEALSNARQIADALEAAHERGVIHRDLKPANIKITPAGVVKVLDFGLAKIAADDGPGPDLTQSPTRTSGGTREGVILGTAAYMSPEQARGFMVDKRADIWAFGAVLFEMLTGRPLFTGETVTDVIAAVVTHEPDWDALPVGTPPSVRRLLHRCLEKDPRQRLRDIGDARLELNEPARSLSGTAPGGQSDERAAHVAPSGRSRLLPWIAAAVCLMAASALAVVHFREAPSAPAPTVAFEVVAPAQSTVTSFQLSPDGRYLALVVRGAANTRLWIRAVNSPLARALPGTEGAQGAPFWSPDSDVIGFFAGGTLKKVSVAGGPPERLGEGAPLGDTGAGTWSRGGVIIFGGRVGSPLQRVSASSGSPLAVGGTPRPGERYTFPHFLPDGERFLYTITGGKPEATGIYVGSLGGMTPVRILPDPSPAVYVPPPSQQGNAHVLFRRDDTLMAQAFALDGLKAVAELVTVATEVRTFTASKSGAIAHQAPVTERRQLVWVDRMGQVLKVGPAGTYNNFRLSPDETTVVFDRAEPNLSPDIWTVNLLSGRTTRLTTDPGVDNVPIWSPTGSVLFGSASNGGKFDLYLTTATGARQEQPLIKIGTFSGSGQDWSDDGEFVLYQKTDETTGQDLWIAPQSGNRTPFAYLYDAANEHEGRFSPNGGRSVAYTSDESGRNEVYLQAFPRSPARKETVSTGGGTEPSWRGDGEELFYLADGMLMAVRINVGRVGSERTLELGTPAPLFPIPVTFSGRRYAASRDGQRFLLNPPVEDTTASPITVVLNWTATTKK